MPMTVPKDDSLFPPQDVYDKVDYLSSLGKTQTAVVQRDADIGVAEAERDAGIRVCGLSHSQKQGAQGWWYHSC